MRELLKKDSLYFIRSKTSIVMILIVPVMTMLILGNMFGESQATGVEVLLCDADSSQLSSAYTRLFNSSVFETAFRQDAACVDDGIASVERGELAAVVIIPEGFESEILAGERSSVRLYLDNSVPETAQLIESSVQALAREMSSEVALSTLSVLQSSMNELGESLYLAEFNLEETKDKLSGMEGKIASMADEMGSLELGSFAEQLDEMEAFLANQTDSLEQVNSTVDLTLGEIGSANSTLGESKLLLDDADALLESDIEQGEEVLGLIGSVDAGLSDVYSSLGCTQATCTLLYSAMSNVTDVKEGLELRVEAEKEMRTRIGNISQGLDEMGEELFNASRQLEAAKLEAADLNLQLEGMKETLVRLNSTILEFSSSKEASLSILRESNESLYQIGSELGESIPKIREIRTTLFSLASRSPEDVVSPVRVSSEKVFFSSRFTYLFPVLVSIVLMFSLLLLSSNSIFYEMDEGTLLRSYLSATSLWKIILSKAVVLSAVALLQTAAMYFVSFYLFSIQLSNLFHFFLLALCLSLSFIILGMLIGALSKDQSTALLIIVAITIPSIFLSGSLFPFEFMPQSLRLLSQLLPLTIGANMMKGIAVYGVYGLPFELLAYIMVFSAALFFVLPRKLRS